MKKSKSRLVIGVAAIFILLVSLAVTLCDAFIPLNIWIHPVLTFIFCLFVGFGILCIFLGFARKSVWFFFLSAIMIGLAFLYAASMELEWWIGLIILVVIWAIFGIISIVYNGNRTEDIALNKSPDYKDYEQRKAEKEAAEKNEEPKELPKIKSFKE